MVPNLQQVWRYAPSVSCFPNRERLTTGCHASPVPIFAPNEYEIFDDNGGATEDREVETTGV
jgi:hypothetical protein